MAHIKEKYYHIVGTPTKETHDQNTKNYVEAHVGYDKGRGYYLSVHRAGRYTLHDEKFGDIEMHCFTIGDKAPSVWDYIVPCNRASKKREQEAIAIFDAEAKDVVLNLGYDIDGEEEGEE